MIPYNKYLPTQHDRANVGIARFEKADNTWFVAPCGVNRDSDALERTNWDFMLSVLENHNGDSWEVCSFNHWACGWFKIVLLKPRSLAFHIGEDLEQRLKYYPVLDEEALSLLEEEENN